MRSFSSLCEFALQNQLNLEHPKALGSQCLIKTPGFCCMSTQLQLKHLSLQVLDVGVLDDGKSSVLASLSIY